MGKRNMFKQQFDEAKRWVKTMLYIFIFMDMEKCILDKIINNKKIEIMEVNTFKSLGQ